MGYKEDQEIIKLSETITSECHRDNMATDIHIENGIKLSETITLLSVDDMLNECRNSEVFVDVEHVENLIQDLCDDDLVYLSNVLNKMLQSKHCY